ncbi:ribosome silencing factor [Bartonella sp. A05]|uniref:ribosome silencing factor n=1 Tax=Bartonella sp. A05 TaxID=2967261 RepID=UPI0022A9EE69|nr:ribosome silencing factor [Bartonella sp. A05]MCZ2203957.1 ribosome silencing factor [Bartonella sp. A05]
MRKDINLENTSQKCDRNIVLVEKESFSVADSLNIILNSLEETKAEDIVSIDLQGKSFLVDYMIIASARSQRHVSAIADTLLYTWKDSGHGKARVEGLVGGDWVLIDTGDIIVHLFRPEIRAFYNLEKIWLVSD